MTPPPTDHAGVVPMQRRTDEFEQLDTKTIRIAASRIARKYRLSKRALWVAGALGTVLGAVQLLNSMGPVKIAWAFADKGEFDTLKADVSEIRKDIQPLKSGLENVNENVRTLLDRLPEKRRK